jgi:hypothetical protein
MNIIRNIMAVIGGYLVFAVSAVALFQLADIDPHADPGIGLMLLVLAYGTAFSFLGGILTQWISKSGTITINLVLAVLMGGFALFSMFKTTGNHYSQLAAIVLFAPVSIVGGIYYLKRSIPTK